MMRNLAPPRFGRDDVAQTLHERVAGVARGTGLPDDLSRAGIERREQRQGAVLLWPDYDG